MNKSKLLNVVIKLIHAKEWEKSIALSKKIIAKYPDCDMAYFFVGVYHYEKKQYDESKEAFLHCIKYEPNYYAAHLNIARIYYFQEKYDEGLDFIHKALQIFPNEAQFHVELSNIYLKLDITKAAIDELKMALALNPKSENANYNYALIINSFYNKAKIDKDIKLINEYYGETMLYYMKVLEINIFNIRAMCNIGSILAQIGDDYIANADNIFDNEPENAKIYYRIGKNYYLDAKLNFLKALEYEPNDHISHYNLGIVYTALDEFDKAKFHYNKVIEIKPDYDVVYKQLEELDKYIEEIK